MSAGEGTPINRPFTSAQVTGKVDWESVNGHGTTASKPAASASNAGYLYYDTDLSQLERSNGATWDVLTAGGGGSGDMVLASVQTVTGAKTFGSAGAVGKLKVAGTTSGAVILDAPAVAGSGTVVLPASGTLATLAGTETLTNKSIVATQLTGTVDPARLGSGTADSTTALFGDNVWRVPSGSGDMVLASTQTVSGAKTFAHGMFKLGDSDASHAITIQGGNESANRTVSLPVLGANCTLALLELSQTWTLAQTFSSTVTALNLKRGTGTPEGAIVGAIGDIFQRTDGGTSNSVYVKETGAGNTGWVAIGAGGGSGDMVLSSTQTVTGAKTFNSAKLILAGSSSGNTTLNAAAVAGTTTLTLPGTTGTLAILGLAQTWSATQTFAGVDATSIGSTTPGTVTATAFRFDSSTYTLTRVNTDCIMLTGVTGFCGAATAGSTGIAGGNAFSDGGAINLYGSTAGSGSAKRINFRQNNTTIADFDTNGDFVLASGCDIGFNTTTGSVIGRTTSDKFAFYGKTPVVQQSSTGETVGFTAGSGTAVKDDSTFTGNVGSTAYRLSDIVKHLKTIGLIAT